MFLWGLLLTLGHVAHAEDYRIAAEDVLAVVVANHPEYSLDPVAVGTTGKITLPTLGEINVSGKTLEQIRADVTQKLKFWLKKPIVTVSLRQQRAERVSVSGAVGTVGFFAIKPGWRISEAITAAGGLKDLPENVRATLTRGTTPPVEVNVAEALANPQSAANLILQADDRLEITLIPLQKITVSGDVQRPDQFEFKKAPRVIDALTLAGWLKQQKTSRNLAFIIRAGKKIDVNLIDAVDNKVDAANLKLQPDDLLLVQEVPPAQIYVSGLVSKPGSYELEPGTGVLESIIQAGGPSTTTDKIVASVRRGNQIIPVDLQRIRTDPAANLLLKDRDTVALDAPNIIRVSVSGSVSRPNLLELKPGSRLHDALAVAGGLSITPEIARINILRESTGGKQIVLNSNPVTLLNQTDLSQDIVLEDGDDVSISEVKPETITLNGEIEKPGEYPLQPGDGLAEVLARAGYKETSALRNVSVTKRNGEAKTYDMSKLRTAEKVIVPLQSGDFVSVPTNNDTVMVVEGVNKPGPVMIREDQPLTLGKAITGAGGPKETARTKQIYILRKVNDQIQKQEISFAGIYNGSPATDLPLQNGDVVFVPGPNDSTLGKLLRNPLGLFSAFTLLFR